MNGHLHGTPLCRPAAAFEADTSSCGVASTPQQVVVTWEYRVGDGTWGDLPTTLMPGSSGGVEVLY